MTKVTFENEVDYLKEKYPESSKLIGKALRSGFVNQKKELGYAQKALQTDPDNPHALAFFIMIHRDLQERLALYEKYLAKTQKKLESNGFWNDEHFGKFDEDIETRSFVSLMQDYAVDLFAAGRLTAAAEQYKEILRLENTERAGLVLDLLRLYIELENFTAAEETIKATDLKKLDDDEKTELAFLKLIMAYRQGAYDRLPALMSEVNQLNEFLLESIYLEFPDEDDFGDYLEDDDDDCCCHCGCPCCCDHDDDWDDDWDDDDDDDDDNCDCCDCCYVGCDCGDCPCCTGNPDDWEGWDDDDDDDWNFSDEDDDDQTDEDHEETPEEKERREMHEKMIAQHEAVDEIINHCTPLFYSAPTFLPYIKSHYEFKV